MNGSLYAGHVRCHRRLREGGDAVAHSTQETVMHVQIRVLGEFEIVVDGTLVDQASFARRDPARLSKFLALAPGRRLHREQVIDALWPDVAGDSAVGRLHKAAHYVRRATGVADSVVLSADTVALFPNADVDDRRRRRSSAVAAERWPGHDRDARRVKHWRCTRGDLLPHDPYEDWAFHHRQRLAAAPPRAAAAPRAATTSWSRSTRPTRRRTSG